MQEEEWGKIYDSIVYIDIVFTTDMYMYIIVYSSIYIYISKDKLKIHKVKLSSM